MVFCDLLDMNRQIQHFILSHSVFIFLFHHKIDHFYTAVSFSVLLLDDLEKLLILIIVKLFMKESLGKIFQMREKPLIIQIILLKFHIVIILLHDVQDLMYDNGNLIAVRLAAIFRIHKILLHLQKDLPRTSHLPFSVIPSRSHIPYDKAA